MKYIGLVITLVLSSAATASAEHHHTEWIKYFAGTWKWSSSDGGGGKFTWRAVAQNNALIGTSRDSSGDDAAWIMGWDATDKRLINSYFDSKGEHGRVVYEILDNATLRGPIVSHSDNGITNAVVTIKKVDDGKFSVSWSDIVVNGEAVDDEVEIVVERQ